MSTDNTPHTRRTLLKQVGAAGSIGLMGLAGCIEELGDDTDDEEVDFDTVQWAVLEPFTGPFSDLGEERTQGTELAIEQVNESDDFDFTIEHETYDTQSDIEDALTEASEALESQEARFFTGCISSDVALAVNGFAGENGILYTPGAADVAITGEQCNEYVFRVETSTAQIAEVMAQWTYEELGDQIFYHIADYAYGHSVKNEFEARIDELSDDYTEIGQTEAEFGADDFEAFITQILDHADEIDALVVGKTGADLAIFTAQGADRGLFDEVDVVTTTGSFAAIRAGVGEASIGSYSGTRYSPGLETGDNQEFVAAYEDAYGGAPDNFARVGYDSIRMVARGIQEAGSRNPATVAETLNGMAQMTVFGENQFRPGDGQALNPVWMAEIVAGDGVGNTDVDILMELDGEDAIPSVDETGCDR